MVVVITCEKAWIGQQKRRSVGTALAWRRYFAALLARVPPGEGRIKGADKRRHGGGRIGSGLDQVGLCVQKMRHIERLVGNVVHGNAGVGHLQVNFSNPGLTAVPRWQPEG